MQLEISQTRTGKHGSARWSNMHSDESFLYEVIRSAENDD